MSHVPTTWSRNPGSFRDPSGFVFTSAGVVYRQVNAAFESTYRQFLASGLYEELARDALLVSHEEVDLRLPGVAPAAAVLRPEQIPFVSYPYEWCFSQLKAAALLTLDIQRRAIARGMVLRDASAYNVQFLGTRPIFIDTLSFGPYVEGQPWTAYRQFCRHFLAPLAMMAHTHASLGDLARVHIDGVPLDLAARLLPWSARVRPGLLMHLHLHGRSERTGANGHGPAPRARNVMSRAAMLGLVDSLDGTVRRLTWKPRDTLWSTYGSHTNYSEAARACKQRLVAEMIGGAGADERLGTIWDLGANTGDYSRLAAGVGAYVVSLDGDHASVEQHFARASARGESRILPLVQDLANPSSGTGWNHGERRSLIDRGPADLAIALALVHHLAIGGNVPLEAIAVFLARICRRLVIEFVPKEDSQVQRMLALREDVFTDYTQDGFERAFRRVFDVQRSAAIDDSVRTMYLMERRMLNVEC